MEFQTTMHCKHKYRGFSAGLTFNVNYTWSHFLDEQDSSGWSNRGGTQVYQNAFDPGASYGSSNFDQSHAVKGSVIYELPLGKGRMFLNSNPLLDAIFGGYQTAATIVAHSGQPFTVTMASSNSHAQAGNQFPNVVGDWHLSNPGINAWYNTAAFAPAAAGTFGNERRNSLAFRRKPLSELGTAAYLPSFCFEAEETTRQCY